MKQSEYKKRCDPESDRFVKQHICGEGTLDVINSIIGKTLFGQTMKEAAKTATKQENLLVKKEETK